MPRVFKVIYETKTGQVLPDCHACAVYSFQSEEIAQHHFDSMGVSSLTRSMADITYEEKIQLAEIDKHGQKPKYKVDTAKVKKKIKDRVKKKVLINIEGVHYEDEEPVKAIKLNV